MAAHTRWSSAAWDVTQVLQHAALDHRVWAAMLG